MLERVYYYTPQTDETVITVQAANFVHKDGAQPPIILIGSAENISQKKLNDTFISALIVGCLLMAGLYHLALFMLNPQRRATLVFRCAVFYCCS